jgi:hypothetical protein
MVVPGTTDGFHTDTSNAIASLVGGRMMITSVEDTMILNGNN